VRRDWRLGPRAARSVKSFTIFAMVAATVHRCPGRRAIGGFTLIELMIVAAVVAILAVVAYPSFIEQVRKSRRQDAISLISQIAQAQERWRGSCPTYATLPNTATAAFPNNCTVATSGLGVLNPSSGYYVAAIPTATAANYTVRATAAGAQAGDTRCLGMELRMVGGNVAYISAPSTNPVTIAASTTDANRCWSR
jgi:type IV pilus assembly protein PilE